MTTEELRKLTEEELLTKLSELRKELSDIQFQVRINKENDFSKIRKTKKEIARILTIKNEKKIDSPKNKVRKEKIEENNKKDE